MTYHFWMVCEGPLNHGQAGVPLAPVDFGLQISLFDLE